MFNPLIFFLIPSPFSLPFPLAVCAQQDCAVRLGAALGHLGGTMSLECGVWPLLLLERQQKAFRSFKRGVQGVFSPAVSSQPWVSISIVCSLPSCTICAITPPWSCPGHLHTLRAHPFPNQRGDTTKSCLFP